MCLFDWRFTRKAVKNSILTTDLCKFWKVTGDIGKDHRGLIGTTARRGMRELV